MFRDAGSMSITLVMPTWIEAEIHAATAESLERAAVLIVSLVHNDRAPARLLARELHWVEPSAYIERSADGLSIRSVGYVHALGRAEQLSAVALWVHTHPGQEATPLPSMKDLIVDREIANVFRLRSGSHFYGALIFSSAGSGVAFAGHLEDQDESRVPINRLWVVGDSFRLTDSFGSKKQNLSASFDRNIRAFGSAVQHTLADLQIGIVGVGGTGSAVAEQLVRLGVQHITLVDPDDLSATNLSRVYGSAPSDVGQPKVEVVGSHLSRINPAARVECINGNLVTEALAKRLVTCDVLFGCTDDNAGRLVLSRMATYLLTPVIDCGVLLSSLGDGRIAGIDGRVTVLTPGEACLVCRGRIDLQRAAAELLSYEERSRRVAEGYAPALAGIEPAVIAFTTAIGAAAVSELLERLIRFGPEPRPSEILLRLHERQVSTNSSKPKAGHYCDPDAGKMGTGVTIPFLDQTWPQ